LDFQLTRGTGEVIVSVLSAEQAMVLKSSLSETKREERRIVMTGRLDGGRRVRVFAIDLIPELVRTGRAHEEVERSRPETVALSDRLQPAYQKVLEEIRGRCRIGAELFVAGVSGRPRGAPPSHRG
jgi:hypothetical protein